MLRRRSVWKITSAFTAILILLLLVTVWFPPIVSQKNETGTNGKVTMTIDQTHTMVPQSTEQVTKTSSSSSSSSSVPARLQGNLSLPHLPSLPHCVNYRIRGVEGLLPHWEQVMEQLPPSYPPLRMGIVTVENPDNFVSLAKGSFHLFHFLEFAVIAFAEWTRLSGALGRHHPSPLPPAVVSWWYSPLLTRGEICGVAGGMNCLIMQILWPTLRTVRGLESNPRVMHGWHSAYRGDLAKRRTTTVVVDTSSRSRNYGNDRRLNAMMDEVDVTLLIDRVQCKREQTTRIHKIWTNYLDSFPAQAWYQATLQGLVQRLPHDVQETPDTLSSSSMDPSPSLAQSTKLVVGYIDRQQTNRRLPDTFHMWLVQYLRQHPAVEFVHIRMERYAAVAQIQLAQKLDMIVGVHGNGLSHQLWMKPSSYVFEMYWDFTFHYDYASMAQLMNHTYRGLYNGQILDAARIAKRDPKMLTCCSTSTPQKETNWNLTASQEAVKSFVEHALEEKAI